MGNRRYVRDAGDLQSAVVQGTNRRLTPGARAADAHFDVLHAVLLRRIARLLGRDLRSEGRALAGAAEAATTGGRPGKRVSLAIGDRNNRVVEGSVDVRDGIEHFLPRLLRLLGPALLSGARRCCALLIISHVYLNLMPYP